MSNCKQRNFLNCTLSWTLLYFSALARSCGMHSHFFSESVFWCCARILRKNVSIWNAFVWVLVLNSLVIDCVTLLFCKQQVIALLKHLNCNCKKKLYSNADHRMYCREKHRTIQFDSILLRNHLSILNVVLCVRFQRLIRWFQKLPLFVNQSE